MQVKKYITKQDINFYIEIKPISKKYQRIVYKDKNNNWISPEDIEIIDKKHYRKNDKNSKIIELLEFLQPLNFLGLD